MKNKYFPYSPRKGQLELIEFIENNIENRNVCVDAPTGFGKTPTILSALLSKLNGKYRIVWAVRTGNETDRPIEELKEINKKGNYSFFGISYRGKRDMCLLIQELFGKKVSPAEASFICRYRKSKCPYYINFKNDFKMPIELSPQSYTDILEFSREQEFCPYLVQREYLKRADLVSLSYNYILNTIIGSTINAVFRFKDSYLVVDEAHNLQSACLEMYSSKLSQFSIKMALEELKELEEPLRIKSLLESLLEFYQNIQDEKLIHMENILNNLCIESGISRDELQPLINDMAELGIKIRLEKLDEGKPPRSYLHRVSDFLYEIMEQYETEGVALIVKRDDKRIYLEKIDMRIPQKLGKLWSMFKSCIFCSGTLKPFNAFTEIVGIKNPVFKSYPSIFDRSKIETYILKGVSTKGEVLSQEMAKRYIYAIKEVASKINSNMAIFSCSYRVQSNLLENGLKEVLETLGREVYLEDQYLSGPEAKKILNSFKRHSSKGKGVLCGVIMGRFSEGADYPGKELETIFLVGVPFEKVTLRSNLLISYFKHIFGPGKGRYYAYFVPALRRASQALGRALRSRDDRALFILGDERYAEKRYMELLPDYIQETAKLVDYKLVRTINFKVFSRDM